MDLHKSVKSPNEDISQTTDIILGALIVTQGSLKTAFSLFPSLSRDATLSSYATNIANQIDQNHLMIEVNNNYVAGMPTVQPVKPPTIFEAFVSNMEDFIDATLGTVVDISARGLSTVLEGVGTAVGNIFSASSLVPLLLICASGYIIFKAFTNDRGSKTTTPVTSRSYIDGGSSNVINNTHS